MERKRMQAMLKSRINSKVWDCLPFEIRVL